MITDRWDNRPTTFLKSFVLSSPLSHDSRGHSPHTRTREDQISLPSCNIRSTSSRGMDGGEEDMLRHLLLALPMIEPNWTKLMRVNCAGLSCARWVTFLAHSQWQNSWCGPGACTHSPPLGRATSRADSRRQTASSRRIIRRIPHQPSSTRPGRELTNENATLRSRPRCSASTFFRFIDLPRVCISQACARSTPRHATRFYDERSFIRDESYGDCYEFFTCVDSLIQWNREHERKERKKERK